MSKEPVTKEPAIEDAEVLTPYHRALFIMLAGATLFEGFDTMLTSLSLHHMEKDFGVDASALATAVSLISTGTVVAFFSLRLADRYGRRPIFLISVLGYTLLTIATAFSKTLDQFIALQFAARMLMVTELALAYVMLGEEMPARFRSRALSLLGGIALAGAALPALALPLVVETEWGWRGLFLLGGALLFFLPLFFLYLRETQRFDARKTAARSASLAQEWAKTIALFHSTYRRRTAGLTAIWFTINFWTSCTLFFFAAYVQGERGWEPSTVAWVFPTATAIGFCGYLIAGRLMDTIGRRTTLGIYFALASVAGVVCYRAESDALVMASYFALMMLAGLWAIGETIAVELFPTDVRATANGLTNNLLGRWGLVLGPAAMSVLIARYGSIGEAASILALFNLATLPLILWLVPETKDLQLDDDTS
ncbi:MAG: MFS family permease [Myxococcota bacterium]|jgi:MFS family permease